MNYPEERWMVRGLSHHRVPLDLREHWTPDAILLEALRQDLIKCPAVIEAVVLSTCNRLEIYAASPQEAGEDVAGVLDRIIASRLGCEAWALEPYLEGFESRDMVEHLFRVAAGLESQMVGETEIFGQVKQAYQDSVKCGLIGKRFHKLFQKCFQWGKKARTETGIGRGSVSVPTVATELAERIFGDLTACSLLVVGTGEMAEASMKIFKSRLCGQVAFCGRNRDRLDELARQHGEGGFDLDDLGKRLGEFDVVLTSTAAPGPVIFPDMVDAALEKRRMRPLFLIDVAVPRDVDPECGERDQVFLYNLDDLAVMANENLEMRRAEVTRCGEMLRGAAQEFTERMGWKRDSEMGRVDPVQCHLPGSGGGVDNPIRREHPG